MEPALEVLDGDGDPSARTLVAIRTLTATFAAHRGEAPAYLQALVEAPRMPPLHDGVRSLFSELRSLLAAHMEEMRDAGALASWVDPDAMSALILAVANGLVLQVTVDPEGSDLAAMAGQFGGLLVTARTN